MSILASTPPNTDQFLYNSAGLAWQQLQDAVQGYDNQRTYFCKDKVTVGPPNQNNPNAPRQVQVGGGQYQSFVNLSFANRIAAFGTKLVGALTLNTGWKKALEAQVNAAIADVGGAADLAALVASNVSHPAAWLFTAKDTMSGALLLPQTKVTTPGTTTTTGGVTTTTPTTTTVTYGTFALGTFPFVYKQTANGVTTPITVDITANQDGSGQAVLTNADGSAYTGIAPF